MATFYNTLGQTPLAQLPKVPTNLLLTGGTSTITAVWQNNNTLTGCTNQTQLWDGTKWVNNAVVASNVASATITGTTNPQTWSVRVAAKKTANSRIYPSLTKSVVTLPPYPVSGLKYRWQFEDTDLDSILNLPLSTIPDSYLTGGKPNKFGFRNQNYSNISINDATFLSYFNGLAPHTFAFWLKSFGTNNFTSLLLGLFASIGGGADYRNGIYITENILGYMDRNNNIHNNSTTISKDVWYHFAFSFDGIDARIYKNATLINTYSDAIPITSVGSLNGDFSNNYDGQGMDSLYVYNRALSLPEIQSLYNSGAGI